MDFFKIIKPTSVLAPYIKHYWIFQSDIKDLRRLTPIGSVELVFHRGDAILSSVNNDMEPLGFIRGQKIGYYDAIPTGTVDMIAVIFQPHGFRSVFNIPTCELYENLTPLDMIGVKSLSELQDKIGNTKDNDLCIKFIDDFFLKQLSITKEYNFNRMDAVISVINTLPIIKFTSLAETACLGYKQFKRIFSEYVGINPQDFFRIVRFQRSLSLLSRKPNMNFTHLAYECGFYDQSHLIHEFKNFTNYNLGNYLTNNSPYSDYFS